MPSGDKYGRFEKLTKMKDDHSRTNNILIPLSICQAAAYTSHISEVMHLGKTPGLMEYVFPNVLRVGDLHDNQCHDILQKIGPGQE